MINASISTRVCNEPLLMSRYSVTFLTPAEVVQSPAVLAAWDELLGQSTNLYRLYQSPEWWNHLGSLQGNMPRFLGVVRDGKNVVVGVVPLQIGQRTLGFMVGMRTLWNKHLRTIFLLGSQPLLPDDESAYHQLFSSLWDSFSDCNSIYLRSVIKGSSCWQHINATSPRIIKSYFPYAEGGERSFHSIRVPATLEEYLMKFSSKRRSAIRRKVKMLQHHGGGSLQLERVDNIEQIDRFLDIARPLFNCSWKGKSRLRSELEGGKPHFEDLARRGILRSYLLRCGDDYCAYRIGYQFKGVYHAIEPTYDPAFAEYSPGQVALLLMIEDLTKHAPPEILSLGHGDQDFKAHFGTDHSMDSTILLMKKSLVNRFWCGCHQKFQFSVRAVKRCIGRNTFN